MTGWMTFTRLPDLPNALEAVPPLPAPSALVGLYLSQAPTAVDIGKKGILRKKFKRLHHCFCCKQHPTRKPCEIDLNDHLKRKFSR
jgi:hypothetical protein